MRYLAIDPGEKRIGLAVGDEITRVATPLEVVPVGGEEQVMKRIGEVIERYGPGALVVGLAVNMDGTVGAGAKKTRAFVERLRERFGLPVHEFDERLSSFEADELMKRSGLTHGGKKKRRDSLAAAAILRDFFEARGGGGKGADNAD